MENLKIWEQVRKVPATAQKEIRGGRLIGKTDINPMWRIKTLTEQLGPCGIGWKYVVTNKWTEKGFGDEVAAFVDIDMFIKVEGAWSEAIPGTGGSMLVAKEKNGPYTSDECFKMALTDAISVSCKALGIGADIYWSEDRTKYSKPDIIMPTKAPNKKELTLKTIMEKAMEIYGEKVAQDIIKNYLKKNNYEKTSLVPIVKYPEFYNFILDARAK